MVVIVLGGALPSSAQPLSPRFCLPQAGRTREELPIPWFPGTAYEQAEQRALKVSLGASDQSSGCGPAPLYWPRPRSCHLWDFSLGGSAGLSSWIRSGDAVLGLVVPLSLRA